MELKKAIYMCAIGQLDVDDLPTIASKAIEDGYDSPSLYRLAAAQTSEVDQFRPLFAKALEELGISTPRPSEAALALARYIASDVLSGCVNPYEGAKQIWRDVYTHFPDLAELRPFVGLASEYEDDQEHRSDYSRQIVEECEALLAEKEG